MFNLNQLKRYYSSSPEWVKNIYGMIPFEIRNGREYRKWRKFLKKSISIEKYEIMKFKETITYAYENVPYYQELLDSLHLKPHDFKTRKDIEKLPLMDKETVRKNYDKMFARDLPTSKTFYVTTGGRSGAPMKFLQSKNMWAKEVAFIMNFFSKHGFETNMLKASFRGGEFDDLPEHIYWKNNPHASEIHFSPFHINDHTVLYYVNELNRRKIKYFHTYPSSIKLLIENMKKNNLKLDYKVDTVCLFSENIIQSDVNLVRNFFGCNVASLFGHSERLVFADTDTAKLDEFYIDRRYGLFELIDESENVIDSNDIKGEMVGTSFDNYAMPLIRYKIGDITSYKDKGNFVIKKIEGRWTQEYLDGKNGMKSYLTALNMHSGIFQNVIKQQFVQYEPGKAVLCIQVNNFFNEEDKKLILDAFNQKAGHMLEFSIRIVDNFILTHTGKFRNIVKEY